MSTLHAAVEQYYTEVKQDPKLHILKQIINFYYWYKKLDPKFERYSRHVRVAKSLSEWSSKPDKVLTAIAEIGEYFDNHSLNWTLDTVYRTIPAYSAGRLDNDEFAEHRRAEKEIEEESKRRLAELRAERREKERKRKG